MYELRYFVRNGWDGPERVLQYRTQQQVADYSTEKHLKKMAWSEWKDVPVVKDE